MSTTAKRLTGWCPYCGIPTRRPHSCSAHSDLPALDALAHVAHGSAGWRTPPRAPSRSSFPPDARKRSSVPGDEL